MNPRAYKGNNTGMAGEVDDREDVSYLQNLIDSIEDGLLVIDPQYRIVRANKNFLDRFASATPEIIGLPCYEVLRTRSRTCVLGEGGCPSRTVFETGRSAETTATLRTAGARQRTIRIHSSPVFDQQGRVHQVIEVIRDITEQKQLEARLGSAEKQAAMGRVAASLAHEINNPLAAIATCVEGLQRRLADLAIASTGQGEDINEYFEIIKQSAYRCKTISEKLLSFASRTPLELKPVELAEVLRNVCLLLEYDASKQGKVISLHLHYPQPLLQADREQLSQLFLNLLINALEATAPGDEIAVTSKVVGNAVTVTVEDTGRGIRPEDVDRIFEPFYSTKESGKGTGLGLAICQSIARQHRGSLWVESKFGRGSTFFVELPT